MPSPRSSRRTRSSRGGECRPSSMPPSVRLLRTAYRRTPRVARDAESGAPVQAGPDAQRPVRLERRHAQQSRSSMSTNRKNTKTTPASTNTWSRPTTQPFAPSRRVWSAPLSPLARNVCRKLDFIQRDLGRIQPGWFSVGRKRDVPKDACYVGRFKDCYVWVGPDRARRAHRAHTDDPGYLVPGQGNPDTHQPRLGQILTG